MYGHPDEMSIPRQVAQERRGAEFDRQWALQERRKPIRKMSTARAIQIFREEWRKVELELKQEKKR